MMKPKTRYFTSSIALAATGACVPSADASVLNTPQNVTLSHEGGGQIDFDINGDADPDYSFVYANNNNTKPQVTSAPFPGGGAYAPEHIMMPDTTSKVLPTDLGVGSVIDGSLYGGVSLLEGFFFRNFDQNAFGGWGGADPNNPTGPVEGYIALRIETGGQGSGNWNYGYAHVVIDVPGGTMKVLETGYETAVNTAITIPAHDPKLVVPATFTDSSNGGPITLEIPVSNGGSTQSVSITDASLSGFDADYFQITEPLPLQLAAGQATTFSVDFDPQGLNSTFTATLDLTSTDPFVPMHTIELTVEVGQPDIEVPASVNFGPAAHDAGVQNYNVEIHNDGFGDLEIYNAYFSSGPYEPRYEVTQDFISGPLVIPGQSTANLPISFDPTALAAGQKSAVLTISSNDLDTFEANVTVNVEVTAPPQEDTVSLAHRWSFNDLIDSVGNADAVLFGTASISGGELVLPGGGSVQDYADVPISGTLAAASSLSFEGWLTPASTASNQAWTKVWMFGQPGSTADTTTYLDFTLFTAGSYPSAAFRDGPVETTTRGDTNPPAIPAGSQVHVVVVYDAAADLISLYVNGALADSAPWTDEIHDLGITSQNRLGAPVFWTTDPDFIGSMNEMRVWRGVLDSNDVAASFSGGPGSVIDPNSIAPPPSAIYVTGVELSGGNIVITGTSGLANGQTYHVQTGVTLADFAPVPGSDFIGGDPIPPVPVNGPKRFVRIASGPGGN